jgi:hypothetical protein
MSTTITETEPVITETKKKVVSLILTHQARIRCLLDMIIKGYQNEKKEGITEKINNNKFVIGMKNSINTLYTNTLNKIRKEDYAPHLYSYKKETEEEEKRFKNCSFLRLCLNKETGICIQLVYEGELDPGEGKGGRIYYITGKEDDKKQIGGVVDVKDKIKNNFVSAITLYKKKEGNTDAATNEIIEEIFTNINSGLNRLKLSNNIFKDVDEYVFYIGRHGQAEHNLKFATHLKTDTDVTQLGKDQAFRAGQNLSTVLKNNNENISYVFASDLIRTRQTIENILKGMNMNKNENDLYVPSQIIILPCSHELKYNSKGACDKKPSSFSFKIGTKENDPKCSKTTHCLDNNITNPESDCNHIKMIIENSQDKIVRKIPLNWDFYFEKNGNKMRKMDCSKTNMIQLAIEYINTSGPIQFNKNVTNPIKFSSSPTPAPTPNPTPNPTPSKSTRDKNVETPSKSTLDKDINMEKDTLDKDINVEKNTLDKNDVCLINCFKKVFNINTEIDYSTLIENQNFQRIREYFQGVKNIDDLQKKTYDDFIQTYNYADQASEKYKDIFNNFVQCLSENCLEKNNKEEELNHGSNNNNIPQLPPQKTTKRSGSDVNEKNNINQMNMLYWTQGFKSDSPYFYKNIEKIARNADTLNLSEKIMDEIIKSPKDFYEMIQKYKSMEYGNKNNEIGFIIDYLGVNDENVLKFMEHIKSIDPELYNKIESGKQQGGKKTRKNRKTKKRFVKRTKRNHKKNKTRRGRRKTI